MFKSIIAIELKCDHSVKTALNQLYERRYSNSLKDYNDKTLLVVIDCDKTTKKHTSNIEVFQL